MKFSFGDELEKYDLDSRQFNEDFALKYQDYVDYIENYEKKLKNIPYQKLFVKISDDNNRLIVENTDDGHNHKVIESSLLEEVYHWAQDWQNLLTEICRFLPDDIEIIRPELHQELVDLSNQTQFATRDLAQALLLLLQNGLLTGRFGKIILEYTYEWVLPQEKEGVRDLYNYLHWQLSHQKIKNTNSAANELKKE